MIWITILVEIAILILGAAMFYIAFDTCEHEGILFTLGSICFIALFVIPIIIGEMHGYINYNESNDKDLARITAITQKQDLLHTYYRVEVEYLTNTPLQEGIMQYNRIEKDVFYCYYSDKELVEKIKNNLYKELWIISGYKGGYENWTDFGTKLIKDIELREVVTNE